MPIPAELEQEIHDAAQQSAEQREASSEENDEGKKIDDETGNSGEAGPVDGEAGESGSVHQEQGTGSSGPSVGDEEGEGGEGSKGSGQEEPISNEAIGIAIRAGMSVADAMSLGTSDRVIFAAQQMADDASNTAAREVARQDDEDAAKASAQRKKEIDDGFPELNPEEHSADVIASHKAMKEMLIRQQEQLDGFKQDTQAQSQAASSANREEMTRWFGGQIDGLVKEFEDVLGQGAMKDLSMDSPKGNQIAEKVSVMLNGYRAGELDAPPLDQLFSEAARLVLRTEYASMEETRLTNGIAKRAEGEIARPGGTSSKTSKTPQEETAAKIDKQWFPNG